MHKLGKIAVLSLTALLLSGCISAPVIAVAAAGTGGANVAGSTLGVSQQYDDLSIKSDIFTILNNLQGLNNANVEVTVFNGIVLLLGQIPTQALSDQLAGQVAKIEGVKIVYNQITVGPNVTFTRFADDTWITSKIKAAMVGPVNPLHFKVVTQEGVVYLLGQVTEQEGNQAAEIAAQTSGVIKVVKIFNYIAPTQATPATENPTPAASPAATTAPPLNTNTSSIPAYAPNYQTPESAAGPAASD